MSDDELTLGIAQLRPDPASVAATMEKLADAAADARRRGAEIVATGETLLPGYPAWIDTCPGAFLWGHESTKAVFARYREQSVAVPGSRTERLGRMAREVGVVLVVGVSERVDRGPGNRTLYNTLLTFDADGRLLNHHRKLVPTYTERAVWGRGDGAGLAAVDTKIGRVGGLVCWEHWMPLPRQALHDSGELVHVAVWPTVHELHQLASRHYAFEGRCFVLAVGQIATGGDLPPELVGPDEVAPETTVLRGGSAIVGPDGSFVTEPLFDEERVVVATVDRRAVDREAMTLDVSGHSSREDVFRFEVRRARRAGEAGGGE